MNKYGFSSCLPFIHPSSYVSFGSESDGGYMDMSKDEPSVYVPMQEQIDTIKYADIQPSPYESPYQQDLYQEQGLTCAFTLTIIHFSSVVSENRIQHAEHRKQRIMRHLKYSMM